MAIAVQSFAHPVKISATIGSFFNDFIRNLVPLHNISVCHLMGRLFRLVMIGTPAYLPIIYTN